MQLKAIKKMLSCFTYFSFFALFVVRAFAGQVTYTYDSDNRLIGASGYGTAVQYTYDSVGNLVQRNVSSVLGALDHITISPSSASIIAGGNQGYTAQAFDQYNNSLGDITSSTIVSISPDGLCTGASCTATTAGPHAVTGTYIGKTSTASLSVNTGSLNSITIIPSSASITAGGSQSYAATGFDVYGNSLGDVTSSTTFTISPDGSCTGAGCTATVTGAHTVMASCNGMIVATSLMVNVGGLSSIAISPSSAMINAGGSQNFMATGFDAYGNSLGDITSSTTFTISPSGSCTGTTCTATIAGLHIISATYNGVTTTANLTVNAGQLNSINISPLSATVIAGVSQTYAVTGFDTYGNSLGDVTSSTTFSITPNGSCAGSSCTSTATGAYTVTGTNNGIHASSTLTVNPGAAISFSVSALSSAIAGTAIDLTVTAKDLYNNVATSYTGTVRFSSNDTRAILPSDYIFRTQDGGNRTFSAGVTLETSGVRTVTATDTLTPSITAISGSISVGAGPVTKLSVTAPAVGTTGAPFDVSVTAQDTYGNTATGYGATVKFSSTDTQAALPANYSFQPVDYGTHTFTAQTILNTVGSQTVAAADIATPSIKGTSGSIAVNPDTTPDPFTFAPQTGVALNRIITSNSITVSGINAPSPISITGSQYSVNGGAFTSAAGNANNGDTVVVQVTSSGNYLTTTSATLTIGGISGTFNVTTLAQPPVANFSFSVNGLMVNFDGSSSTCPTGDSCAYSWDFGDSATGSGQTTSHAYGSGGTYTTTLTVTDTTHNTSATVSKSATVTQQNRPPVCAFAAGYPSQSFWTVTVKDASSDPDTTPSSYMMTGSSAITVTWGNGTYSRTSSGGTVSYTYTVAGNYTISLTATDNSGLTNTNTCTVSVSIALGTVTGTVKDGSGHPVNLAKVQITVPGSTKTAYTNTSGVYTINNVQPGTGYPMTATSGSTTFATQAWVTSGVNGTVISGSNTVNFTP